MSELRSPTPSTLPTTQLRLSVPDLAGTTTIAKTMATLLEPGTILLLEGNLGSGKTAFVKGLGQGLGITETITSPTFTLIDEYCVDQLNPARMPLYHMDLYRLEPGQVQDLYLQEYWRGIDFPLGVVAIEWADRLNLDLIDYLRIIMHSEPTQPNQRQLELFASGDRHCRLINALREAEPVKSLIEQV
jgi:tRNA threonylcarbamoyladenosine biosynthesis protein TsaE